MDATKLNEAIDFYNQGSSMAKTAKQFHSTPDTLKKLFKAQDVHIRNQKEQLILENIRRTKDINHNYFDELTDENSYYLGFFAADATVRKDRNEIKIALANCDRSFLEQLRIKLKSEKEVKTYTTTNGFDVCEFSFSSLKIKEALMSYGIVPNKTYKGIDLNLIPDQFKLPFIKGFYDGDGGVVYNQNTKQVKVFFTSHTQEILNQIKDFLKLNASICQDKRTGCYSLEYSTVPSLQILTAFYMIETPCLDRKHKKYLDILELRK